MLNYLVKTSLYNRDILVSESIERYKHIAVARSRYTAIKKGIVNIGDYTRKIVLTREKRL
jgi:hypothetical protein